MAHVHVADTISACLGGNLQEVVVKVNADTLYCACQQSTARDLLRAPSAMTFALS